MLTIILADTELETVPVQLAKEPDVSNHARRRKKKPDTLLLDSSYMHTSVQKYFPGEANRRGRPDLVHTFLMVTQESILNRIGQLRTLIHTRNNLVITVHPEARLPKSYSRFVGLMETLFQEGHAGDGDPPLLALSEENLDHLVKRLSFKNVKVLSPRSGVSTVHEIVDQGEDLQLVIGGFAFGDYLSNVDSLGRSFSIFKDELTVWTVASELIVSYERATGTQL